MAPQYKLTYFNAKGQAEVIRYVMAYADFPYEDIRIERENWAELKPKTPFGQLPFMEVDGEVLSQSGAIMRLVAKRAGLMGKTDMEEAKINMVLGCMEDCLKQLPNIMHEADEDRKKAMKAKYQENLAPQITKIEALITGDYFVGNQMSLADFYVANGLPFPVNLGFELDFKQFPKLKALQERVNAHPKIAAWIAKRPETKM